MRWNYGLACEWSKGKYHRNMSVSEETTYSRFVWFGLTLARLGLI